MNTSGIFVLALSFFFFIVSPVGADVPDPNAPHCIQQTPPAPVQIAVDRYYKIDDATMTKFCTDRGYNRWTNYTDGTSCDVTYYTWVSGAWRADYGGNCPDSYNPGMVATSITCAANVPTIANGCPQPPPPVVVNPGFYFALDTASKQQVCIDNGYSTLVNYTYGTSCGVNYYKYIAPWWWYPYYGGDCPDSNNPGYVGTSVTCTN